MERKKYLIVGGSGAGLAAATTIRSIDPEGTICILSDEKDPPYFRPMIPFLLSQEKTESEIYLSGQGYFHHPEIDIRLNCRADSLDPIEKTVSTSTGELFSYESLLIATGSRSYIPDDIQGTHHHGVFCLRTLSDAQGMAERVHSCTNAVMLGGGLLNLKAAAALLKKEIRVTLVVYSPTVLSQLMDPEDTLIIRKALKDSGLQIITGVNAQEIHANGNGVTGVLLDNGTTIDCQMVCIGKGVRANIEWLSNSGIELGDGVVVDHYTRTNFAEVYAAGDVAVTYDPINGEPIITGLWTNAMEMGRCAGLNMAGKKSAYAGTLGIMNATQIGGVPFVSMGKVHTDKGGYEVVRKETPKALRKMVFSRDEPHLVGTLLIGDIAKAGLYRSLIREKLDVTPIKNEIIHNRLHYGHILLGKGG